MASLVEWKTCIRELHTTKKCLKGIETEDHPLKVPQVTVRDRLSKHKSGHGSETPNSALEPLSVALEGLDPLTQFALQERDTFMQDNNHDNFSSKKNKERKVPLDTYTWNIRKNSILDKFTTSEKLSIVSSFLVDGEKVSAKPQSVPLDKVQYRLEQLDSFEEGSQRKLHLTQTEYISRIQQLNKELVSAWNCEQRVKALKIAIQCAKLLADTDVLWFYPSKFVLITDILDVFGKLVYDRLRMKADYVRPGSKTPTALPEDFSSDMVPETAKETCRNWFFKIASIRELVPRLYVEMALIQSYKFLNERDCFDALSRIPQMINGIGNPLVAVYARCYLCRVGQLVPVPLEYSSYLMQNFCGFLDCYNHLFNRCVKQDLIKQNMDSSTYMTLFSPALDFILQSFTSNGTESLLSDLLTKCSKIGYSSLVLNSLMASFKPIHISQNALKFLQMFKETQKHDLPQYILLRTLCLCVNAFPPPTEHRREILGLAWNYITVLTVPEQYISCAEVWIKYTVQNFSVVEINAVLGDIIEHMNVNRVYEKFYPQLKSIIDTILLQLQDLEIVLTIDNFLPYVDLFQQETVKVDVCKRVLQLYNNEHRTSDPVVTNALIFLCTVLHDSVNALTVDDEVRQIGEILCNVIRCVDYGQDFEQQLNFYVEARAAFSNIDAALVQLVQKVNLLAVNTRKIVKGYHTNKTADFVRACAAYCFITIPCLGSVRTRLELYLLTGRVALFNQCLSQADACFEAAFNIIHELDQEENLIKKEDYLVSYAKSCMSALLIVPDNPNVGVLKLTKKLLSTLQKYEWNQNSGNFINIYLASLDLLSAMAQETFPYHVDKIESNDALYGSDPKFINEVDKMCTVVVEEILSQFKAMGPSETQAALILKFVKQIAIRSDINHVPMQNLLLNLWQLCLKYGHADIKELKNTKVFLEKEASKRDKTVLKELVAKLKTP